MDVPAQMVCDNGNTVFEPGVPEQGFWALKAPKQNNRKKK